jgi:hypothetical protein
MKDLTGTYWKDKDKRYFEVHSKRNYNGVYNILFSNWQITWMHDIQILQECTQITKTEFELRRIK